MIGGICEGEGGGGGGGGGGREYHVFHQNVN